MSMPKYTIQLSKKAEKDLVRLTKRLGVKSKAEAVRKALNLLLYLLEERKGGGKPMVENAKNNSRKEVVTI